MQDAHIKTAVGVREPAIERFSPDALHGGMLAAEHMVRYRWAAQFVAGKRVLDAACGTAYGSAMLVAAGAAEVVGIDIDANTISQAKTRYGDVASFDVGDVLSLPYDDASFDVVVSFETIEHVSDPFTALDELRRVAGVDGLLVISTPNNLVYTPGNPHHLHEFSSDEFIQELQKRFTNVAVRRQHTWVATGILDDVQFAGTEDDELDVAVRKLRAYSPGQEETYVIALAGGDIPDLDRMAVALNEPVELKAWDQLWHEQAELLGRQAAQLTEQAELLTRQHTAVDEQIQRNRVLKGELAGLREALLAVEADLAHVHDVESELAEVQSIVRSLRNVEHERDLAVACHFDVIHSTSWRTTAPLRKFAALARRLRNRAR